MLLKKSFQTIKMFLLQASALRSTGKREEALELLDQLIERWPEEPIMVRIKQISLAIGNPFDALPYYESAGFLLRKMVNLTQLFNGT